MADRPIGARWKRLAAGFMAIAFVVVAVLMEVRPDSEWAQVFVLASRQLVRGEDFYHLGTLYLYPPFGTILGLPFVALPEWAVRLAFYCVNVVCVVLIAVASWRLAGLEPLGDPSRETRDAWVIAALGVIAAAPYAWNTVLHQQADLVIDALVALGMLAALNRRSVVAGVLIGLGASIKGPPLLFVIYFLWRRDWRAVLALLVTVIVAGLLPDLIHAAPEGVWASLWLKRHVLPAADLDATLGAWATTANYNIYNQSLGGTIQRLINTRFVVADGNLLVLARDLVVGARPLKLGTYAIMAAMGLVTFLVSFLAARRRETVGAGVEEERRDHALELAIVPLLMLSFSLMSGLAHFPIVAPAAVLLARRAVTGRDGASIATLGVAVTVAIAVNKDLVGRVAYDFLLWSGVPTLAPLALWLGLLAALLRPDATPGHGGATPSTVG